MMQFALCQELDAVTACRQYCVVFIDYQYIWYEKHFDILKRLGATHECDRRTEGQTDILIANCCS